MGGRSRFAPTARKMWPLGKGAQAERPLYIRVRIQEGGVRQVDRQTCLCQAGPPRESPLQGPPNKQKWVRPDARCR